MDWVPHLCHRNICIQPTSSHTIFAWPRLQEILQEYYLNTTGNCALLHFEVYKLYYYVPLHSIKIFITKEAYQKATKCCYSFTIVCSFPLVMMQDILCVQFNWFGHFSQNLVLIRKNYTFSMAGRFPYLYILDTEY